MASQYGTIRKYTSDYEGDPPKPAVFCPQCKVNVVPRGITSTRYSSINPKQESSCPSCGHIFGRNALIP